MKRSPISEEVGLFGTKKAIHRNSITKEICGWIVDPRSNPGGTMWPMIAGLGSLIGEGQLGVFKEKGHITNWYYRDGRSWLGDAPQVKVSHPEFALNSEENPVAVLMESKTASSGQATAIAFRGRPKTQLFGKASTGLATSNEEFVLRDGAVIVLTTATELDRTGQEYNGSIIPDFSSLNPEQEAVDWLLAQPSCTK